MTSVTCWPMSLPLSLYSYLPVAIVLAPLKFIFVCSSIIPEEQTFQKNKGIKHCFLPFKDVKWLIFHASTSKNFNLIK